MPKAGTFLTMSEARMCVNRFSQNLNSIYSSIPSDMVTRVPDDPNNRFRRTSFQSYRSRSRSPSPMGTTVQPSELLPRCIDILGSIVLEDCRFQVASLRLRKPPNALQALVLDVSQVLIHTHRNDPKVVRDIALALVPAFYTYPSQMHAKLLGFFEDVIMRSALMELDRIHFKRDFPNNQSNFGECTCSETVSCVYSFSFAERQEIQG